MQRVRRKLALHQRDKNMRLAVGLVSVYATACLAWRTRLGTFDAKTGTARTPHSAAVPVLKIIIETDQKSIMRAQMDTLTNLINELEQLPLNDKIDRLNEVKRRLHEISPFRDEPVDCIQWVQSECVTANDYNPNSVAPPEMELLRLSIAADGYTQPIVACMENGKAIVVDGFHRHRVGKECAEIQKKINGYLPIVQIRQSQEDRGDRIASTIRHNRARGKHGVDAMSEIVIELKRRNWSDEKIGRELGMDQDEVLRLTQIQGLTEMFLNHEFCEAWEAGAFLDEELDNIEFDDNEALS